MAVLVLVQNSIMVGASASTSYVKRVPGLDGMVSVDVLDVPGYATYEIVTDLDGNRIGLWKPRSDGKRRTFGGSV